MSRPLKKFDNSPAADLWTRGFHNEADSPHPHHLSSPSACLGVSQQSFLVALLCFVPVLGISLASDLCPVCIAPTFPRTEHHRVVVFSYLQVLRCFCCLTQFCADWVWSVVLFTDFDFSNGRRLLDPKIPATRPSCPHLHHQLNAQYLAGLFSVSCIRSSTQKLRDYDVFQ